MPAEVLSGNDVRLLTALGFVASGAGLHATALTLFDHLSRLRPFKAFGHIGWACHLMRQGQPDDAVWVLQRALRLMQDQADANEVAQVKAWLGVSLRAAGRQSGSDRAFSDSLALSDQSPTASMARAMLGQKA